MVRRAVWWGVLVVVLATPPVLASAAEPTPDLEPVDLGGTRVEVSTDAGDPTVLTAGLWADTLTGPGGREAGKHRFRYRRTMADSTVLVGVVATSTQPNDAVQVSVAAPDGTDCDHDSSTSGSVVLGAAFGVRVSAGASEPGSRDDPCLTARELDITVDRYVSELDGKLPVAIRVVEEAPVASAVADLPEAAESPSVPTPQPAAPEPVTGGGSFDDAPELGPGTFADAVPEGAERLYRVRLDWGQALAVRVDVPAQDEAALELTEGADPTVELRFHDPLRNSFRDTVTGYDTSGYYDSDEPTTLFDGSPAVGYLNRFADEEATVPGDYWVSLAVSPAEGRPALDVPVEIAVEVVDGQGGSPDFPATAPAPGGDPGPEGYADDTPYLVDTDTFSADVSGTPRVPEAAGADDDVRRTAGLVVGGASLLSLLAGTALLARRRRPRAG